MRIDGGRTFIDHNWLKVDISSLDEEQVSKLQSYLAGKKTASTVYVDDFRHITADQNKKVHAMIGDMARYTGYTPKEMEEMLKYFYVEKTGKGMPDFADCSVETASQFIEMELDIAFAEDIPFKMKTWDSIKVDYRLTLMCIKHRRCIICGKHADIHHTTPVGSRSRRVTDHRKLKMLPLCRYHHQIAENTPTLEFAQKYQVKGVKVPEDILISLGIMTRKQMNYWDNRYRIEGIKK